jgi:hypothetical protein
MCEPTTIMLLTAGAMTAAGQYQQGQAAKVVGRNNQIMSEYAAQDALQRGEEAAIASQRRTSQLRGTQRAAMAARGLDLGSGTPAELIDQTDFFGEQDVRTARTNAKREAWSARVSGADAAMQGRYSARQGATAAGGSILGGGAQAADKWYTHNPRPRG